MTNEINESFILSASQIDRIAARMTDILTDFKLDRKAIVKIRLLLEGMLSAVLNGSETPRNCTFSCRKRFGSGKIRFSYDGTAWNPLEEEDEVNRILLKNLGIPCEWNYRNNLNTLFFSVKKHSKSSALPLLAAILAAAALGFCSQWIPQSVTEAASAYLLVPFREAFLGLLNALAGILIFFTVLAGLCGDKDTEPLGAKSRRMLIRVPVMMAVFAVFSYLLLLPFSGLSFSGASAAQSQTKEIADLLWGIVPNSIVQPFLDGNYIHILILAMAFGLALAAVRDRFPELIDAVNGINTVLLSVTGKVCRLIPLFAFCSLLNLILSPASSAAMKDIWKPVVMFVCVSVLMTAVAFAILGVRYQCNVWKVWKTIFPACLISMMTGSSLAAYSTNLDILENRFGISKRFSGVGLSITGKIYGPGVVIYLAVMVVYCAGRYGTPINIGWIVTAIILTVLLIFACPPVPGALLVIFGVLAKQFGFPDECMVILATVDVVLDGRSSGCCCVLRNAELIFEADTYQELDKEVLKRL